MAQTAGHGPDVHPRPDQVAGVGVAEVVEPFTKAKSLHQVTKFPRNCVRVKGFPEGPADYQVMVFPVRARSEALLQLGLAVPPEGFHHQGWHGHGPGLPRLGLLEAYDDRPVHPNLFQAPPYPENAALQVHVRPLQG